MKINKYITYGEPAIGHREIKAVLKVIKTKWIGSGPVTQKFEEKFKINPKEYFSKEIEYLGEMIKDDLVTVSDDGIKLTKIGEDFSQNIANVFDKYDPPSKSDNERLVHIEKAKLAQAKVQELA